MTAFSPTPISSLDFFASLVWLDGRPLLDTIEPYRQDIFRKALDGSPGRSHPEGRGFSFGRDR
jgi:hypothetical protein